MVPRNRVLRLTAFTVCLIAIAIFVGATLVAAQDFNIDYDGAPSGCPTDYGGAILELQPIATSVTAWQYLVIEDGIWFQDYGGARVDCPVPAATWFTYACNSVCAAPIKPDKPLHLGITLDQPYMLTKAAYVYRNHTSATFPWQATANDPVCDIAKCSVLPLPRLTAAEVDGYACLSGTGWWVHANGKTLTVINGSERCPCPSTLYVGRVRFEYYGVRQALNTLNRYSRREPFRVDTLPGATAACAETLNFSHDAPAGANFVVVNARADVVPTLDSPAAVEVWIQQVIVPAGQHLIVSAAEPHGTMDPRGPVVVPDHGSQTIHIIPDAGFVVSDVHVDGVSVGRVTSYAFIDVTRDHEVLAKFELANEAPECTHVAAVPATLWPPDHKLVPVHITGLTDADGDPVAVTVKSVTQDEPLGQGAAGISRPDAVVTADGDIELRAERDGKGNGRVYTIAYTASDGRGGTCDGSVRVCVPHDRGHSGCQDDGETVNSLGGSGRMTRGANHEADDRTAGFGLRIESIDMHVAAVHYSLPAAGPVRLAVFDLAGRRVVTLSDDVQEEGDHVRVWNTAGLARGMYFCRLQVGSTVLTRSRLILR